VTAKTTPAVAFNSVRLELKRDTPAEKVATATLECLCAGVPFAVAVLDVEVRPDDGHKPLRVRSPLWQHPDTEGLMVRRGMLSPRDLTRLEHAALVTAWTWVCGVMGWKERVSPPSC
jgi:hypothetical protein